MSPTRAEAEAQEEEFLRLDEFVCFVLYSAHRAVTNAYRPLLDDLGLTYPQYLVLVALYENGPSSVKGLGAKLHLDYGTLTPLLKRLEANGLVLRRRSADDERQVTVSLTEEGATLRRRARVLVPALDEIMGLTGEEMEQLKTLLRRLTGNIAART
ncbi:MarR family winged helix-turn-helix transcriptional regulator [Nonomuraea muscovyensis]|uniref:DNA-binding MarR family transcriptional regulator n=1 Tax=Nonomuraea muscovyensis TaxID=1124761 RepID=A0A7X0C774_9ACTN|nr:MarR family transcriptional regulator [Nonomuraea muscovyensis]MBB6349795.1 DNA-binding MarR family transcriptional regulator [Nonomuraea muscovyensis]MDF2711224.1 MarR family transcriptional regulator [Nonomuraea muscovyensis]